MKTCICLLTLVAVVIAACNKDSSTSQRLEGKWTFKSQYDFSLQTGQRGQFDFPNPYHLEFSKDGRVYSDGVTTPTWVMQLHMGSSPYKVHNETIAIGDSVNTNGTTIYLTYPHEFKIFYLSNNLLVMQHLNDNMIYTIDSLVR